jgi:PE-PPE domain-containing protein
VLDRIDSVVLIGNAYNPDGGFFTRLGFLGTIPFFDVTFGPPTPVDTGIPMTGIGFEYDPVMYAPLYLGNLLAVVNAVAALQTVHGNYLTPNGNGPTDPIAYGYTDAELAAILATSCPGDFCRVDSYGNEYYMIPAKSLPMFDLIMSFVPGPVQPFVKPIIDLVSPVAEVLINLGYDWSGDAGVARVASFLPFNPVQNWFQVGLDLVEAVGEGIENPTGGLTTTIAPLAPAPLSDTPTISALSAPAAADTPANSSAPQVLSMTSPSTSPESDPVESLDAGAALTLSTAADTGERTPAETVSIALRSDSEPNTETPSQRRKSGNLFRPGATTADTSPSEAQSGQADARPATTATNGATTAGQSATGGAGSTADSQDADKEAA